MDSRAGRYGGTYGHKDITLQWHHENPEEKGNIRGFANVSQLVCLANLENLNAHFIQKGLSQPDRLERLNQIAIQQMRLLVEDRTTKQLGENQE